MQVKQAFCEVWVMSGALGAQLAGVQDHADCFMLVGSVWVGYCPDKFCDRFDRMIDD